MFNKTDREFRTTTKNLFQKFSSSHMRCNSKIIETSSGNSKKEQTQTGQEIIKQIPNS